MDLTTIPQLARNAVRFHEIMTVLGRYGLARWFGRIDLEFVRSFFRAGGAAGGADLAKLSTESKVRMALIELGPTFIKLGQMLSTRQDVVGAEMAAELSSLQTSTSPDPPAVVRRTIESELSRPIAELFAEFDPVPLACASIGQVHGARLEDGRAVVVKVQKDAIVDRIKNDLEILIALAEIVERYDTPLRQFRPVALAKDFRRSIWRELDYRREARHIAEFARNFADHETVRFPVAVTRLTSKRVLTMERLDGIQVSDTAALLARGSDLDAIARTGADLFLDMIFRDGFYHADPHPGNLLVLDGDVIGVLDCGMVGRLDDGTRERIEQLMVLAVRGDADRVSDLVLRIGQAPADLDRDALRVDVAELLAEYLTQSLDRFDLSGALTGLVGVLRRYSILLPSNVSMLVKVLVMLEGTARHLSPRFSLAELLQPYYLRSVRRRYSPARVARRLRNAYYDWDRLLSNLPRDLADILEGVRVGRFEVTLHHRRLESVVDRLVHGILTAALFLGSALFMSFEVPPALKGVSIPGALGCTLAFFLGLKLFRILHGRND